ESTTQSAEIARILIFPAKLLTSDRSVTLPLRHCLLCAAQIGRQHGTHPGEAVAVPRLPEVISFWGVSIVEQGHDQRLALN
uniref:Uncharacterized protein n=1 Tax=Anopheles arabiensis TaxID=7173 RepID=A0A182I9F9_ANOAR